MKIKDSAKYLVRFSNRAVSLGTTRDEAHGLAEMLNKRYGGGYAVWNRWTKRESHP